MSPEAGHGKDIREKPSKGYLCQGLESIAKDHQWGKGGGPREEAIKTNTVRKQVRGAEKKG